MLLFVYSPPTKNSAVDSLCQLTLMPLPCSRHERDCHLREKEWDETGQETVLTEQNWF